MEKIWIFYINFDIIFHMSDEREMGPPPARRTAFTIHMPLNLFAEVNIEHAHWAELEHRLRDWHTYWYTNRIWSSELLRDALAMAHDALSTKSN